MNELMGYFSMGKYGFFVWGSYFAVFLVMIFFAVRTYKNMKTAENFVKRYLRRKGIK